MVVSLKEDITRENNGMETTTSITNHICKDKVICLGKFKEDGGDICVLLCGGKGFVGLTKVAENGTLLFVVVFGTLFQTAVL